MAINSATRILETVAGLSQRPEWFHGTLHLRVYGLHFTMHV